MKVSFRSRVSKSGSKYYITIPAPLHHIAKKLHGKEVVVVLEVLEEASVSVAAVPL
jgi:hypothetical protein